MWRVGDGDPRATIDIDLLIQAADFPVIKQIANDLGYRFEATPMRFLGGAVEIRRVSKIDPESADVLILNLLLVTAATKAAWETRLPIEWEGGIIRVVSREGLIALKSLRGSGQDLDDIALLREDGDES